MFKANMLLSLCSPPRLEHGGVGRLRPGVQKCKCLFSLDSSQHTHYLDGQLTDEESFILMMNNFI